MSNLLQQKLSSKNHFIEIDAFRGICAVLILFHHYSKYIQSINHENNWFFDCMEFGKYAVHFFFVISGLLIFMTLEKSSPAHFILNRFSRLYPAYWLCMTLTAIAISVSPYYRYAPVTSVQYLANLTMFQHWMHIEDMDGIYWTLAVEICFYILIFLVFISKRQKNIERIGTAWLAIMLIVFALMKNEILPAFNYYYYIPLMKNGDLFFAGILFYRLMHKPSDRRIYILLLLTLVVHLVINPAEETIVIGFIYLLLFLFVIGKLRFLRNNLFYFFGVICYSLYLLHQYIGYEIINYLSALGVESTFYKITITATLMIGLASAVTFFVERPAMKFLRKKLIKERSL